LRRDLITKKDDPIEMNMYEMLRDQIIKKKGEVLLKTGAKLFWDTYYKKYFIGGYHYAGEDVDYYFKKKEVKKE